MKMFILKAYSDMQGMDYNELMKRVKGSRRKDASKAVFADTSDSYNGNK